MINKFRKIVLECGGNTKNMDSYLMNLTELDEPPYIISERYADKYYKKILQDLGYPKTYFTNLAKNSKVYEEYNNVVESIIVDNKTDIIKTLQKYWNDEQRLEFEINSLLGYINGIYENQESKKFILHTNQTMLFDFNEIPDMTALYPIEKYFDKINDCFIGFNLLNKKYSNIYVRVMKPVYTLKNNKTGNIEKSINISILKAFDPNVEEYSVIDEFFITKNDADKFIYIEPFINCDIDKCPYKNKTKFTLEERDNILKGCLINMERCKISKRKLEWEHCIASIYSPYKLLSLVAYLWDMFENRNSITRKNSVRKPNLIKAPISIHEDVNSQDNKDYKVISINNYYKYEKEYKGWQGGHHKSPVEHERRGHERIYRNPDGSIKKIVKVKSSTINKGGQKAIYHIDTKNIMKEE